MIKFQKGDKVKLIDDNQKGVVLEVLGDEVKVLTDFGFEQTYHNRELLPDVDLDQDFISNTQETEKKKKKKKSAFAKSKKNKNLQTELTPQQELLAKEIEDNLSKNSAEFRQKLEEKYQKEIKRSKKRKGTFVLDLHYGKLESFSKQLPTDHILKKQLHAAINGIEKAKNEGYKKIILVHGKGKGVLEMEVKKYLNDYGYTFYDANFNRYKLGATEVEL